MIARREIVALAKDYLAVHPELIAEAKPIVEQWRKEGFFGKKVARPDLVISVAIMIEHPQHAGVFPLAKRSSPPRGRRAGCCSASSA